MQISVRHGWIGALAAVLLASCGGGQVEKFNPERVLSFGDETSVIDSQGRKYSINALKTGTTDIDCATYPIWNQYIAGGFNLVFPQCNPQGLPTTSQILAQPGTGAEDVKTQIDNFLAAGGSFSASDMVTVLAGTKDVIDQYNQIKAGTISETQATATLEQAGADLADQVNRMARAGAKVIVSTIPSVGQTPFAASEEQSRPGSGDLLTRLTGRFNAKLRTGIIDDGHMIGLVLADETFRGLITTPGSYTNLTQAACQPQFPPPTCTTATLITDSAGNPASATTWLWADATHLSAAGQGTLATLGLTRATNNPF